MSAFALERTWMALPVHRFLPVRLLVLALRGDDETARFHQSVCWLGECGGRFRQARNAQKNSLELVSQTFSMGKGTKMSYAVVTAVIFAFVAIMHGWRTRFEL
jgi:hypothetical protein